MKILPIILALFFAVLCTNPAFAEQNRASLSMTSNKMYLPSVSAEPWGTYDMTLSWSGGNQDTGYFVLDQLTAASTPSFYSSTFTTGDNTLEINAVDVSDLGGIELQYFQAKLKLIPDSNPWQFMLTESQLLTPIGEAGIIFDGNSDLIRYQESAMGNLIADVMVVNNAIATISNTGAIRNGIAEGKVFLNQIAMILPFNDTIVVIKLFGSELVAALDHGLSHAGGETIGSFPNVSAALKVTYCKQTPCAEALLEGGIVTALSINNIPVDMNMSYPVATNNYLAMGGDNYLMFEQACNRGDCTDTGLFIPDLLAQEFQNHSPVIRQVEGRIVYLQK